MNIQITMTRLVLVSLLACTQLADAAKSKQKTEPDFTKGELLVGGRAVPWALGATGAFGNIYYRNPRQIQISSIAKGSPADGKLKKGDVILGVKSPRVTPGRHTQIDEKCRRPGCGASGKAGSCGHFTSEARKALSAAITASEKNNGKLVISVWRPNTKVVEVPLEKVYKGKALAQAKKAGKKAHKTILKKPISGKTALVTLKLPVKGSFSATSPWKCTKTKGLIDDAAQAIVKRGLFTVGARRTSTRGIDGYLDALGLLATGEEKYLSVVRKFARVKAKRCEKLDIMKDKNVGTWDSAYLNLFLTEYYLMTKDEAVLPGIKALSTIMAYGQSGVGTWSHGMAYVPLNGLYGPPCAYGAMNSCSVVCAISLVNAQKCGITTKPVNDAVIRSRDFYRFFVDKGTIPYGDHKPAHSHDNNGKNSMAAVFYDLLGDKEATAYYTRMTLASYDTREGGHTGHFFGTQWGALGASRGGPRAANSFAKNTRWFTELERRAGGSSFYQYQLSGDHHKYGGWSTTGQRLLQHCLPRKALYITGKAGSCITPFTNEEVKVAVDATTFRAKGLSVKELMSALGSWSLVVRQSAAEELGKREENIVDELIAMTDSPNRYARYGACTALRYCGRRSIKAIDKLVEKLENDKDMSLHFFAAYALRMQPQVRGVPSKYPHALGSVATKAASSLLKLAAKNDPKSDPMQKRSGFIADVLLGGSSKTGSFPRGKGHKLDRKLLIPAMKSWLANPNGAVRSVASTMYKYISEKDLAILWPDIYYSTKYAAPSGVMFAGGVRADGILIMAQNQFKEGLDLSLDYLYMGGWGKYTRPAPAFNALSYYGSALKPHLEKMKTKEYRRATIDKKGKPRRGRSVNQVRKAWKKVLDNIDKKVALRSIEPFMKGSTIKPPKKVFPKDSK